MGAEAGASGATSATVAEVDAAVEADAVRVEADAALEAADRAVVGRLEAGAVVAPRRRSGSSVAEKAANSIIRRWSTLYLLNCR